MRDAYLDLGRVVEHGVGGVAGGEERHQTLDTLVRPLLVLVLGAPDDLEQPLPLIGYAW